MKKEVQQKNIKVSPASFVKDNGRYYDVNYFEYFPNNLHKGSLPSAVLLQKAFEAKLLDKKLVARILEIQDALGINSTLWGLRFENNTFSLEFYFFYPKKFPQNSLQNLKKVLDPYLKIPLKKDQKLKKGCYLISYNLNSEYIEKLNIYYPVLSKSSPLISMDDIGYVFNSVDPVFNSFYYTPQDAAYEKTNTYYTFFGLYQLYDILEKTYECCRKLFPDEDPVVSNRYLKFPYLYDGGKLTHTSAVTLKESAIGFYFLDLSVSRFITFLKYHKYPDAYIRSIEKDMKNLDHLKFDVGVDFYLKDGKFVIKKTAFWGSF